MTALRANSAHDVAISLVFQDAIFFCPVTKRRLDHGIDENAVQNRRIVTVFDNALAVHGTEKFPVRLIVKITSHVALAIEHVLKALIDGVEIRNVGIQAALVRSM